MKNNKTHGDYLEEMEQDGRWFTEITFEQFKKYVLKNE